MNNPKPDLHGRGSLSLKLGGNAPNRFLASPDMISSVRLVIIPNQKRDLCEPNHDRPQPSN
jgi:hypothetical protein